MILLDTHAWVWWANQSDKLSRRARSLIKRTHEIGISVISCWELAMLVHKHRLRLDRDVRIWIEDALSLPKVSLIPLSPAIAVAAATLSDVFQADPADRIIVATAQHLAATLITKDDPILQWPYVRSVW